MARLPGEYGLKSAVYGAEVKDPMSVPRGPLACAGPELPLPLPHAASRPAAAIAARNPAAQRDLVIADTFLPGGGCVAIKHYTG
jgi:hypothetical protein